MSIIKLTPRLRSVADAALGGRSIADVGTDHGYVCVYIAQKDGDAVLTAADINPAPLESARRSAAEYGVYDRIRFVLADGLRFSGAERADTVILAGMGGETIMGILSAAPWTKNARLVLQPQSKLDRLCLWLGENGYGIESAALCREGRRLYTALTVTGAPSLYVCAEDALMAAGDPLLPDWLDSRSASLRRAVSGMERAGAEAAGLAAARELLRRLENTKKEL